MVVKIGVLLPLHRADINMTMPPSVAPETKRKGWGWAVFILCAVICPLVLPVDDFKEPLSGWGKIVVLPACFCILLTFVGGMASRIMTVPLLGWLALPGLVGLVCHWSGAGMLTSAIVVDAMLLVIGVFALCNRRQVPAPPSGQDGMMSAPKFRRDKPDW